MGISGFLTMEQATKAKKVSRQAVHAAIKRGDIDGEYITPQCMMVVRNDKFEDWEPRTYPKGNTATVAA